MNEHTTNAVGTLKDVALMIPQLYSESSAAAYSAAFRRVEKLTGFKLAQLPANEKDWADRAAGIVWAGEFKARTPEASQRAFQSWVGKITAAIRKAKQAQSCETQAHPDAERDWQAILTYVSAVENTFDEAGTRRLPNMSSRSIDTLRARAGHIPPRRLTTAAAAELLAELPSGKVSSFRASVRFFDKLIAARAQHCAIAALLPEQPIGAVPGVRDAALRWEDFSDAFLASMDAAIARVIGPARPAGTDRFAGRLGAPRPGLGAGRSGPRQGRRKRAVSNAEIARKVQKAALSWLVRYGYADRAEAHELSCVADLVTPERVEAAVARFLARVEGRGETAIAQAANSLNSYLSSLSTLAARNEFEDDVLYALDDARFHAGVTAPGHAQMSAVREAFVKLLDRDPAVVTAIVTGPRTLAQEAGRGLARWENLGEHARCEVLHVMMAAVMLALQLSRPLRTRNIHLLTIDGACPELTPPRRSKADAWLDIGRARVKNRRPIENPIRPWAWRIVGAWIERGRPLWIAHHAKRGFCDNDYLFPGATAGGAISRVLFNKAWNCGMERLGLAGLTPHMMRHVAATLYLAQHPGAYDVVASLLGDKPSTVEAFYARGEGRAAAELFARVLESQHPELKLMGKT